LIGVFTFGVIGVWVIGIFPGRSRDGIRGGSCVFPFVMRLYCVNNGLGVGCYLIGGWVADNGKVGLVLGPGLEAGSGF
jgi:hypothetical protein